LGFESLPRSYESRRSRRAFSWLTRDRKGSRGRDEDLVFAARGGKPVMRQTIYKTVKAAARAAGVPWAGVHTLRHSYATRLFREGVNVVTVSRLLGHHDPAFTSGPYVHLLDGRPRRVARAALPRSALV
jgi:site-specific recombinase XerD